MLLIAEIIAGGFLITLLVLSLLTYPWTNEHTGGYAPPPSKQRIAQLKKGAK